MKRILLMLALVVARCGSGGGTLAFAQTCPAGHTLIQDTIYGPVAPSTGQPTLFFGTVTISTNSAGHGATGAAFGRIPMSLTISNGNLTACLIPNDTATPINTTYTAKYAYVGNQGAAAPWTETWSVPTSGSPVTLASVRLLTAPPLLQGAAGPAGAPGPAGAVGAAGVAGATGAAGVAGPTGQQGPSGTGNAPYPATVTAQTSLSITAATHGQGVHPVPYCWDAAGNGITCEKPHMDSAGNLTFTWATPFSGSIVVVGGGTGAAGAQGTQGAQGPAGTPGLPAPPDGGTYCVQVSNFQFYFQPGTCANTTSLSYMALTDAQYTAMTDLQYTGMTN